MSFNENEILEQLDLAFDGIPSSYFPLGRTQDVKYNFIFDLEHGYFETAGSRIHLYADEERWAIVSEKSGYQNRGTSAAIELNYIGNCINYPVNSYPERNYISNTSEIYLIEPSEFERIENKDGEGVETFELIGQHIDNIKVRDKMVSFDSNYKNYEKVGIKIKDYNGRKLVGFGDLIRYLHEMNPSLIEATDDDIRKHIPQDIPKIMTISEFHYESVYEKTNLPSLQETCQLIAKILVAKNPELWKPKLKANNSWKNWDSGNL